MKTLPTAPRLTGLAAMAVLAALLLLGPTAPALAQKDDSQVKGLWLVLPDFPAKSEFVELTGPNGLGEVSYTRSYDGMLWLTVSREKPGEYGIDAVKKEITAKRGVNLESITVTDDEKLGERLSYPVFRAEYTTGRNEDTQTHIDLVIFTDPYTFRVAVQGQGDYMAGYSDEEFDLKTVDAWFSSLEFRE